MLQGIKKRGKNFFFPLGYVQPLSAARMRGISGGKIYFTFSPSSPLVPTVNGKPSRIIDGTSTPFGRVVRITSPWYVPSTFQIETFHAPKITSLTPAQFFSFMINLLPAVCRDGITLNYLTYTYYHNRCYKLLYTN